MEAFQRFCIERSYDTLLTKIYPNPKYFLKVTYSLYDIDYIKNLAFQTTRVSL